MRKILFLVYILSALSAAAGDLYNMSFDSAEYEPEKLRTGDSVFCRIKLSGQPLNASDAEELSAVESINYEVNDIKLNISSGEILIWFIPFNPDEKYLPVIKSRTFILEKVPVRIERYSSSDDDVPEPPGAVLLPGTRLFFGFAFFIFSLFIFFIYYFIKYFYKPFKKNIHSFFVEAEIRKILSALSLLYSEINKTDPDVFCSSLNRFFKKYLDKRFLITFSAFTSGETADYLSALEILDPDETELLKSLLYSSDRIRFGKKDLSDTALTDKIYKAVLSAVDKAEDKYNKERKDK